MMAARFPLLWTLLAALAGCVDKTAFTLVKNACLTDTECADAGAICDSTLLQCVREEAEEPYQVILQVRPSPNSVELPAGESLVEQETFQFVLDRAKPDHPLPVPLSQLVTGQVSREVKGVDERQAVEAELTFTPEQQIVPVAPTVVYTRGGKGAPLENLTANLNPNVRYNVRVLPLGEDSKTLAPFNTTYPPEDGGSDLVIVFPEMAARGGELRDERGTPLVEHRIRLEDKVTGQIVSTTATTLAGNGAFELHAPRDVMEKQSFNVVVSLKPFPLWRVKVAVDGSRLVPNVVLTIPSPPVWVEYQGTVRSGEAEEEEAQYPPAAFADMLFSSRFPVEDRSNDPSADWCRWHTAIPGPEPICSGEVAASTDQSGRFSVRLLPGTYDVFISPSSETGSRTPLSTTQRVARVTTQADGGPHSGVSFYLQPAIRFEGLVQSPGRRPMPNVRVTAQPLQLLLPMNGDAVYRYARPAAAITERRGTFELDVDHGYFDLTVEPPEESGFAWVHSLNRVVSKRPDGPIGPLQPSPPVPVSGHVQYEDTPLPGAVVEAFALITEGPVGQRAVRIAQTVTDDAGAYRLALPPAVRGLEPQDGGVDGGNRDGGVDGGSPDAGEAGYSE
jgi:hypothetical protein